MLNVFNRPRPATDSKRGRICYKSLWGWILGSAYILLTAMFAVGAEGNEGASVEAGKEAANSAGFAYIADHMTFIYPERDVLQCGCIRSSSNYACRWLFPDTKKDQGPICARSCPAYYGLYGIEYDFRRGQDYQWNSYPYQPRRILPPCAQCEQSRGKNIRRVVPK